MKKRALLVLMFLVLLGAGCGLLGKNDQEAPEFEASAPPTFEAPESSSDNGDGNNEEEGEDENNGLNNEDDPLVDNDPGDIPSEDGKDLIEYQGRTCEREILVFDLPKYDVPGAPPPITQKKVRTEDETYEIPFLDALRDTEAIFLKKAVIRISGSQFDWIDWADIDVIIPEENEGTVDLAQADPINGGQVTARINGSTNLEPFINNDGELEIELQAFARAPILGRTVKATLTVILVRSCR